MKILLTAPLLLALLAATPALAQDTRPFTDGAGRTVAVPAEPERVVILNDSNGGAQALELGVAPVGMTTRGGEFELADRYDLGDVAGVGDYNAPDLEAIAALRPDLIVGYAFRGETFEDPARIAAHERVAPLALMETGASVEAVMAGFADLLGREARLDALRARDAERPAEVRALLGDGLEDLTVSVIQMEEGEAVSAFGRGWFAFGEALEDLGIAGRPPNQAEDQAVETCRLDARSLETLPEFDADVVLHHVAAPGADASDTALFGSLRAARAGQAFAWDDDWWGNTYATRMNVLDDLARWFAETPPRDDVHP